MSTALLFCTNCGAANQSQAVTCFACGQALSAVTTNTIGVLGSERLVKNRYRIVRQVGTGGFGAVYLAEDVMLEDYPVALKEIRLGGLKPQEMIEATDAFNREVSLLPGLRHGHLPRVYDHFTDPEHWYLIMEYIEGETLESYVQKMPGGSLPVEVVLDIGIQLADVLDYLHSRQPPVIFRDLKPANIMRTPAGHLYLIDFGIARIFKPGQPKDTIAFGSPGYAPPEQYGKTQTTPRSDLYSLGATLHFLLTGDDPANTPFSFAPLSFSVLPTNASLQRLLAQLVELDAGKRPDSAQVVKRELQEIASELLHERLRVLYPVDRPAPGGFIQPYVPSSSINSGGGQGRQQSQMGMYAPNISKKSGQSRRRFVRIAAGAILTTVAAGSLMQLLGSLENRPDTVMGGPGQPMQPAQPAFDSASPGHTYFSYPDSTSAVTAVGWSPDGRYIIMGNSDQIAQVFQVGNWGSVSSYAVDGGPISDVTWSQDGSYIAVANEIVQIWQSPTFSPESALSYTGHQKPVNSITWSLDSKYIASASDDGTVQVWQTWTGMHLYTYRGHQGPVNAVAWSPDGKYIASGGADGEVHIWKPFRVSDPIFKYKEHSGQINALAWSAPLYGGNIASASSDKTVRVWNGRSGKTLTTYKGHTGAIRTVAWSPTDMHVASAGDDKSVRIWNPLENIDFFVYSGHSNAITSLAWSPDGRCIVSGSSDMTMQVWQAVY